MEGAASTIADVPGLSVGHYTDLVGVTGCTVVLCQDGATGACDVRGAAPATHETDLLRPENSVQQVNAILLTGGSAFGLLAASGVARYLEERGLGFQTGAGPVPIVPAAALFDLSIGDAAARPDQAAGYAACQAGTAGAVAEGSVGAGTGATVGHLRGLSSSTKGGLGSSGRRLHGGATVGAMVAVNAFGDVVDPGSGRIVAGARRSDGGYWNTVEHIEELAQRRAPLGESTTLAVIATDAVLERAALLRVAQMAHDGLARTIRPVHTGHDGDIVFAISTAKKDAVDSTIVGTVAAELLAEAVLRAVLRATSLGGIPTCAEVGSP